MHQTYTYEATYRPPTEPRTEPPALRVQAVFLAVPPALVWAVAHPTAALVAVALVAAAVLARRAEDPEWRPQPTDPPD